MAAANILAINTFEEPILQHEKTLNNITLGDQTNSLSKIFCILSNLHPKGLQLSTFPPDVHKTHLILLAMPTFPIHLWIHLF